MAAFHLFQVLVTLGHCHWLTGTLEWNIINDISSTCACSVFDKLKCPL